MAIPTAAAHSTIVKASVSSLPEELNVQWRAAGWALEDVAVVDARHLVLVFFPGHASPIMGAVDPGQLTKYTDNEDHAPYQAKCLKLGTLRHYREQHQDLEGTWDPMEGRSRIASTFAEYCERHGVRDLPHGAHLAAVEATYQTDDTSLIYCTSRATDRVAPHAQWRVASRIRDARKFAVVLGAQFARQCDEGRHTAVTGLDFLIGAAVGSSGLDSVVQVHHGPVVYDDNAGDVLFARIPEHARGIAAHFFKRTEFEDQQEYRFVLSAPGGRPNKDEFYLKITADLRSIFQRQ